MRENSEIYVKMTENEYDQYRKQIDLIKTLTDRVKDLSQKDLTVDLNFNFKKRIVHYDHFEEKYVEKRVSEPIEITGIKAPNLAAEIRKIMKAEVLLIQEFQRLNRIVDRLPNWLIKILSK